MSSNVARTEADWSDCESVIRRFEDAWHDGRPAVESFLPVDTPHRTRLLVELVHVDLEFRIRAGEAVRVEEYFRRFPVLDEPTHKLDLLRAEYRLRARHQPPVTPEEYAARFPEHQAELWSPGRTPSDGAAALTPTRRAGHPDIPLTVTPSIPGYELLGELGRGGMGVVYKALDTILHRTVAVKTLGSVPGAESCARFARETEAIARLDHPHIVPVYEVGEWRAGEGVPPVPYFVMKWYPGGSLDAAPAGRNTDLGSQVRTVELIARAVHHAHARGVLHRDLKPSNILLDGNGWPHVADFGLAGRFDPNDPRTLTAAVVGTPAYMAPEQARTPNQVTTAVDVYGLGAILYHQLTGRPPFEAATALATLDRVTSAAPVRPSAVNPAVPRDLDTLCLKCLEKDPTRRYATAADLADDLERWRTGRPVHARPTPTWEHVWRWLRRHPLAAVLTLTTLAALVTAVVVLADSNARTHAAYLRESALRCELQEAAAREQRSLYLERVSSAGRLYTANQLPQAWALLGLCPEPLRRWEWRYLTALRRAASVDLPGHQERVGAAAFLADGRLVTADRTGEVRVWHIDGRKTTRTWRAGPELVTDLAAHPTRPWVAGATRGYVVTWDADSGAELHRLTGANRVGFSPCGRWAATAERTRARVWSLPNWEQKWEFPASGAKFSALAFPPTGDRLVTGASDGTVRTWSLTTGIAIGEPWRRPRPITGLAFTADGKALVEAHPEGLVVADPVTGRHRHRIAPTAADRAVAAVGPNSGWVAVVGPDREVIVWDARRARPVRTYRGHTGTVATLAFSADSHRLASAGTDRTVRVWDLAADPGVRTVAATGAWAGSLAASPDGTRLAVGPRMNGNPADDCVLLIETKTGRELRRLPAGGDVAFQPGSHRLASGRPGGGVVLWDIETGAELWSYVPPAPGGGGHGPAAGGCRLAFAPDGAHLAVWTHAGGIRILNAVDGALAGAIDTPGEFVYSLVFSEDSTRLAVGGRSALTLWDVRPGVPSPRAKLPGGTGAVAYSPDGQWLATADRDQVVRLRAGSSGEVVRSFVGPAIRVNALTFNADGTRLVTGGADESVRVWDVETGRELLTLPGVSGQVLGLTWDHSRDAIVVLANGLCVWSPEDE